MVDSDEFRQAWAKFATGVSVITTIQSDGLVHGMTAQGICSVSLDPMLALVCVGHNRNTHGHVTESRRFCINILSVEQQNIAEYFARPPERREPGFHVPFSFTERGAAMIGDSLASMDCRVVESHVAGDHTIFIGEVDEIEAEPRRQPPALLRERVRTLGAGE